MPTATLLLRETNASPLSTVVEKSQSKRPPLPEYDLRLRSCQLDLILVQSQSSSSTFDEGFESDVDTSSIVSSDDSFSSSSPAKTETDSANGSACSDTDDEPKETLKETHDLVKCLCYSDVKFPDLLVFVIGEDALVFKFGNLVDLQEFHTNFNTLKAVTNQKAYGRKFNLLQRTDNNGITHIEISGEYPSSILSLDESPPKKPERRKKLKGKAPSPPIATIASSSSVEENVFKGEYIRVNVPKIDLITEKLSQNSLSNQFNIYSNPKLTTYQQFKYVTESKNYSWTSSMPRSSKGRSRSETRNFTPMAYRYVDTTINPRKFRSQILAQPVSISNRLFGMSGKLKDFSSESEIVRLDETSRWSSLGELSTRNQLDANLKSVIKKEDAKKKEKKVTFSAYATVQVV